MPIGLVLLLVVVWWINLNTQQNRAQKITSDSPADRALAITQANQAVLVQRNRLLAFYNLYLQHKPLGLHDIEWIRNNIYSHRIYFNPYSNRDWQKLLESFKPVLTKPIVQQAVMLSHYGTSDLARYANNYFNILIGRPEFGWPGALVNEQQRRFNWLQPNDIQYAKYFTPQRAVTDYIWLLNTAAVFRPFRHYRDRLLEQHKDMSQVSSAEATKLLEVQSPATASQYGNNTLPTFPHIHVIP